MRIEGPSWKRREELLRFFNAVHDHFSDDENNEPFLDGDDYANAIAKSAGTYGLDAEISKLALGMFNDPGYYEATSGLAIDSLEFQRKERERKIEEYLSTNLKKPLFISLSTYKECLDSPMLNNQIIDTLYEVDTVTAIEVQGKNIDPLVVGAKEIAIDEYLGKNNSSIATITPSQSSVDSLGSITSPDITVDPDKTPAKGKSEAEDFLNKPRFSFTEENPYQSDDYAENTKQSQLWHYDSEPTSELEIKVPWYLARIKPQNWQLN